jgi:hypothetical protein
LAADKLNLKLQCVLLGSAAALLSPFAARSPLDIPIEKIAAEPAGKAVLDANLPQLTGHASYDSFKSMTLRQLQPLSQGQITDEALTNTEVELRDRRYDAPSPPPVDPSAFRIGFGVGATGASLVRPDGYIAWRSIEIPTDPLQALVDALRQVSFAKRELQLGPRTKVVEA